MPNLYPQYCVILQGLMMTLLQFHILSSQGPMGSPGERGRTGPSGDTVSFLCSIL